MKRICVFAHWDKDNTIDDYVVYYLNALKEICEKIIFVSDCDLSTEETDKIKNIAYSIIAKKHGEYDFGSYKRGFLFALNANLEFDELIFANDSCYGPLYPLKPIFEKMDKEKCNFWGMTRNRYGLLNRENRLSINVSPHIQSYFIVLKKEVFTSDVFKTFISSIKAENSKDEIIEKYEIGLSQLLYKNGFKSSTYIKKYYFVNNCIIYKWKQLIRKDKFPFLKTTIIKNGDCILGEIKNWDSYINKTNYPIKFIEKHSQRNLNLHENKYAKMNLYRKIKFHLIHNSTPLIKFIIAYIEKHLFLFLNTLCFNKLKKF